MKNLKIIFSLVLMTISIQVQAAGKQDSLFDRTIDGHKKLYDAFVEQGMSKQELRTAFEYFDQNRSKISNTKNIILVDFSKNLIDDRFYILNLKTGGVKKSQVSHGFGSDPDLSGRSVRFSNVNGSNASSLGFYLTMNHYSGAYGYSLKIRGLSKTNSHVFDRTVVIHGFPIGSDYDQHECRRGEVRAGNNDYQRYCLRDGELTRGCFGLPKSIVHSLIDQIEGGTLIYAFN